MTDLHTCFVLIMVLLLIGLEYFQDLPPNISGKTGLFTFYIGIIKLTVSCLINVVDILKCITKFKSPVQA